MEIKQEAEKFGLAGFDLKLFRLEKIDGKAENFAVVTKAQLEGATLSNGKCHKWAKIWCVFWFVFLF